MANSVGSNGTKKALRPVAYFRTVYIFTLYPQVRNVFLVERFWKLLRIRFLRAERHGNFEYSFDLLGVGFRVPYNIQFMVTRFLFLLSAF